jgi:uncharacterized protein
MKEQKNKYLKGLIGAITITVSACSFLSPQTDHSRYFVLQPIAGPGSTTPNPDTSVNHTLTIGLGPITIPRYLDRPEVVTRLSDTEFSVSDTDRWGEPLDVSVPRVLAQDLSTDLPGLQIVPFPWSRKTQIDYRVSVDFRRLERTADGRAEVQAVWTLYRGRDNNFNERIVTTASASAGDDPRTASAALSQGIAQVSRDIAQALQNHTELKGARGPQVDRDSMANKPQANDC